MNINFSITDKLNLGYKLVAHRLIQYYLSTNEFKVVDTNNGAVRGRKRRTIYNDEYFSFEGIPYAQEPVGALRFRAPKPVESWIGVRDCIESGSKPMQENLIFKIGEGSENCLYLNVYVKNVKTKQRLPVMVWIYGGGFTYGEATRDFYSPDYLMKEDIILVTVSYRVGAFGFLSLNDPDVDVPGNAGLKDQLLAIQWIHDNIDFFNGDDNNITIFGESAGGASVHFMMLTNKSKGLFHKAILQSGNVLCPWACVRPENNLALRLAQSLGYMGCENDKEIYRFLVNADAKKIVTARLLTRTDRKEHLLFPFCPVVEPYESESALFTRPFVELLRTAWTNEIPVLLGYTSFEGLFAQSTVTSFPYILDEYDDGVAVLPDEVKNVHSQQELYEMSKKIKYIHFGDKIPRMIDSLDEYLDLLSYKYFVHAMHRTLLARLKYASSQPTYFYRFDVDSPHFNHYRIVNCGPERRGTSHADDISYLFYHIVATKLPKTSMEFKTIERMVGIWTNFARTSNPNCIAIDEIDWSPVNTTDNTAPKCLNISTELSIISSPEEEKLRVWDLLYVKEPLI